MSAVKKYVDRVDTCVSVERAEKDLAKKWNILLNDALRVGLHARFEACIMDPTKYGVTPEDVEIYRQIKDRAITDLKEMVAALVVVAQENDVIKDATEKITEHRDLMNEKIRVYDTLAEKSRDIYRHQMRAWYEPRALLHDEEGNLLWTHDVGEL